ncbi:MAG TPA: cytochrome c oxidase subunit II [Opitutaceae bacterium]|nr:cytochrome c oxidase subunit II [Opitutaceae bacterium]
MRLPTLLSPRSDTPISFWQTSVARWTRALLALAGIALLTGCDLKWWQMDGHQSTLVTEGPVAHSQAQLFYVTCWVTAVIFVLVGSVLAYATFKFRAKTDADEHAEPPAQSHGNPLVEIGLIAVSVIALVIIAIPTLHAIIFTHDVPAERKADAYTINATGVQWWFRFEYPAEQISGAGSLVTSNELVIPAGRPVRINIRTLDVIHSFWVPKLGGKVDMIPNRANFLWLEAEKPGYFWGQCAEYCGDSHAVMRFRVIALGPKDFNDWLDKQLQPARTVTAQTAGTAAPKAQFASLRKFKQNETGITAKYDVNPLAAWQELQKPDANEDAALIARGRQLFTEKTCSACHAIRGHMPGGSPAYPDLTHIGSRSTIAAGLLENNAEQLQRWLRDPGAVKPGNKMWVDGYVKNNIKLTEADEIALVAYLQSLK